MPLRTVKPSRMLSLPSAVVKRDAGASRRDEVDRLAVKIDQSFVGPGRDADRRGATGRGVDRLLDGLPRLDLPRALRAFAQHASGSPRAIREQGRGRPN